MTVFGDKSNGLPPMLLCILHALLCILLVGCGTKKKKVNKSPGEATGPPKSTTLTPKTIPSPVHKLRDLKSGEDDRDKRSPEDEKREKKGEGDEDKKKTMSHSKKSAKNHKKAKDGKSASKPKKGTDMKDPHPLALESEITSRKTEDDRRKKSVDNQKKNAVQLVKPPKPEPVDMQKKIKTGSKEPGSLVKKESNKDTKDKKFPEVKPMTASAKIKQKDQQEREKLIRIRSGFYQAKSDEDDTLEKIKSLDVEDTESTRSKKSKSKSTKVKKQTSRMASPRAAESKDSVENKDGRTETPQKDTELQNEEEPKREVEKKEEEEKKEEKADEKLETAGAREYPVVIGPTASKIRLRKIELAADKKAKIASGFYQSRSDIDETLEKVTSLEVSTGENSERENNSKKDSKEDDKLAV